jgi:uncharacterized membrane protein
MSSVSGGRVGHKHASASFSQKTVPELRKMASKAHVKQTRSDGTHKNKAQLVASLNRAKHGHHGGASGGASGGAAKRKVKHKH